MNSFIETLNQLGGQFLTFAWPMFWQSSLLIVVLFAVDFLFRRKIRASIRYALWLAVLVKLCLPPTLALPTSAAWWLFPNKTAAQAPVIQKYVVTYDTAASQPDFVPQTIPVRAPVQPKLNGAGWTLLASGAVSAGLLLSLTVRWWRISRKVRRATAPEKLAALLDEARRQAGLRSRVRLKLVEGRMSPAVCGLFEPVILLPRALAEKLSAGQLRAVLLHELVHLRRKDVWVNCAQALLQIAYWWHPLLWLANARIRRLREEAVDDAVMLALRNEAESYAPTLLEVAKLAFNRPLMSLGLFGIMESRSALRQRIERLVNFRTPRKAGLTLVSLLGILAFIALAVPMGGAPSPTEKQTLPVPPVSMPAVAAQNTNTDTTNVVGILNDPNFRVKLHMLEQRNRAEPLAEPKVTTTSSGRGINRITMVSISVPLSNYVSASHQSAATNLSNAPDNFDAKVKADRLVQDAKLDYEMGKLDEAEKLLKSALALDSENAAAKYYLGLVQTARQSPKTNQIKSGRQNIVEKLDRIRLARVSFERLSLEEALRQLSVAARQNDPEKIGVNIGITTNSVSSQSTNINSVVINMPSPLENVRLADVLDAIVLVADQPIKYSILDDGVFFSMKDQAPTLFTRTFRIRKYFILDGLRELAGLQTNSVPEMARSLFSKLGVDWESPKGKAVFYNDRLGLLFVKATKQDLDTIERAIGFLSYEPAQMTNSVLPNVSEKLNGFSADAIAAAGTSFMQETGAASTTEVAATNLFTRTFKVDANVFTGALRKQTGLQTNSVPEMARNYFKTLGVDWERPKGKAVFYNDRLSLLFVRATESELETITRAIQALNQIPPQIHIKARFLKVPERIFQDFMVPNVFTNDAVKSRTNGWTELLTDEKFRSVLRTLETKPGFQILGEPECVTTSGRQTQMRATQIMNVVTNFTFSETASLMVSGNVETGPILDAVATVLPDGYTIDLKTTASVTEFMGYDQPTNGPSAAGPTGEEVRLPTVLPMVRTLQTSTHLRVWDGQTIVMAVGALAPAHVPSLKQPDPQPEEQDREVLAFVTATIVDSAGNRVHSDDEMPFAKPGPPPQPY